MKYRVIPKASYCAKKLFSFENRERCITRMKTMKMPAGWKAKTPGAPNSSVLIPVCTTEDIPAILYTVRSPNLRSCSGQTSFPGGTMAGDETPAQTALRETQEEIGLSPARIDIWGHGAAIPSRNQKTLITPVIGSILNIQKHDLNIDQKQVSDVFLVPLEMLCDPDNQYYTQFRNGTILPVFVADEYKIWGMTGYLTHSFLTALMPEGVYKNEWQKKRIVLNSKEANQENVILM